jgi:NADH-quinone oxidoreductase subunit H
MSFWMDPLKAIGDWLIALLTGWGMAPALASFLIVLIGAVLLPLLAMLFVLFLIWYERKLLGRIQDRYGPNRLGPWGIFQTFADMGKIFVKEIITPTGVDTVPYNLAPVLAVAAVLAIWAVMPLAPHFVGADLSVGLLFVLAAGGFGELGIMLAGWSSNNKYALLAGFRAAALLISYEVPMVISLIIPAMLAGSLNLTKIVEAQGIPFIFWAPVPALIFFVVMIAESGRAPFDISEAESEIVAGFNTEYSGLKFGMFYVGDFLHAFTSAMLYATIFLGGYRGPFVAQFPLLGLVYLFIKTFLIYWLTVIIRGAMPRFRIDQMLSLNWKIFTPLSLAMIFVTAFVDKTVTTLGGNATWLRALVLLVVNLGIFWLVSTLMNRNIRPSQTVVSGPRPVATAAGPSSNPGQD